MGEIDRRTGVIAEGAIRGRWFESWNAHRVDALVEMAMPGCDAPTPPAAMVHVVVDYDALMRGHSVAGERCEIPGIGPIPVATARMLAADSIINVLLVDVVDVTRIAHTGRTVTAHQRTALRERTSTCEVPGCDTRTNLEIDHNDPWALSKNTSLDNLNLLCRWHHYQKTHCGHRLTGPPGHRQWHAGAL